MPNIQQKSFKAPHWWLPGLRTLPLFVRGSITVWLTCLTGFEFEQTCKSASNSTQAKQLNPNQSNKRAAIQWYFLLQSKWVFSSQVLGDVHSNRVKSKKIKTYQSSLTIHFEKNREPLFKFSFKDPRERGFESFGGKSSREARHDHRRVERHHVGVVQRPLHLLPRKNRHRVRRLILRFQATSSQQQF